MSGSRGTTLLSGPFSSAVNRFFSDFSVSRRNADVSLLGEILKQYADFPYENISKLIKSSTHAGTDRLRMPDEVFEDHWASHLGGTCFSLTFYLKKILEAAGFDAYVFLADMRWGRHVHCGLVVRLAGKRYLVDPGYLFSEPMEIHPDRPRMFRNEFTGIHLAFHARSNRVDLYTFNAESSTWRYAFSDEPVSDAQFLDAWNRSFEWKTMTGICLNRIEGDTRVYIHNTFMREERFSAKKNSSIKDSVHRKVYERFGIEPRYVEQAIHIADIRRAALSDADRSE